MGEWKCNQEVIMCSIKVVQTSFCTKPKPSFNKPRNIFVTLEAFSKKRTEVFRVIFIDFLL